MSDDPNPLHKKCGLLKPTTSKLYERFPLWQDPKGRPPRTRLKAIGFTSGIGSMLIGARDAGFGVVGNIEWRDYYRLIDEDGHNTFIENFPGAFLTRGLNDLDPLDLDALKGIDLAMGHPECGAYSLLNSANKNAKAQKKDSGDIPLFLEYVAAVKPRFFVMDDLPQAFMALPMEEYHRLLPEYDLFPEWISNYHYGNPQKHRKRMFMIGALKTEHYTFEPGEKEEWDNWTVLNRIGDIQGKYGELPNHDRHTTNGYSSRFINMRSRGDRPSWLEVQRYFKKHQKPGQNFAYHGPDDTMKIRPSLIRMKYDYPCPVLTGGNPMMHPELCLPISIRERARLQGFPDDFVFYGTKFDKDGRWEHNNHNMWMVKQTGKAMPIEFNRYVAKHIAAHIKGKKSPATNQRFLKPDQWITQAKYWYCDNVGYSEQERACEACWHNEHCDIPGRSFQVPLDVLSLIGE